jgi:SAM-dependent methyltransferase
MPCPGRVKATQRLRQATRLETERIGSFRSTASRSETDLSLPGDRTRTVIALVLEKSRRIADDRDMADASPPEDAELAVQPGYAAWAPLYDDDGNPLVALEGPAVRARFGAIAGRRAIDIGCGTGRHTLALADEKPVALFALDVTPEMMAIAQKKLRGRPVQFVRHAFPHPMPFQNGTFDLAVLGLVIEHVRELETAFLELHRILAPGGRAIVSALHPDRTAEGQRARFIDPITGTRRPITTYHRSDREYLTAASASGLVLESEESICVTPALAESLPRAERYLGKTLGWVATWSRPDGPGADEG